MEDPVALKSPEQISDRVRLGNMAKLSDEAFGGTFEELAGLDSRPIDVPRVARHDPANVVGIDAVLEQPEAGICASLAGTNYDVPVSRPSDVRQVVQWRAVHTIGHRVGRAAAATER